MQTLLTFEQLAERWSCSRDHIERLYERGDIAVVNISPGAKRPTLRVHIAVIEAFEGAQHKEVPKQPAHPTLPRRRQRVTTEQAKATIERALQLAKELRQKRTGRK